MRKLIFILFSIFWLNGISQVNLVPNPSFEQCLNCNCGYVICEESYCSTVVGWYNPTTCSPDYYKDCYLPPQNFHYQIVDGDGFVGIGTYNADHTNFREYVACQLLDTMQAEKLYHVSFYARHFYGRSMYASNNLGIHFSDTALHASDPYPFNINHPPMLEAQVKYFNNEIISDTAHWTLISGVYLAHGGETWLTIGNFNTDQETAQGVELMLCPAPGSYLVLDMVSVIPLDSIPVGMPCHAGVDTTIFINDTAFIGQKVSNMPATWHQLDGTPVATNTAGVYVSPQITTTYVVEQTLNGLYSTDTVTVFVINNLGLKTNEKQQFEVYPVPSGGDFTIQGTISEGDQLMIHSMNGEILYQSEQIEKTENLLIESNLSSGLYFVSIYSRSGQELFKCKIIIIR